jgi:hypothetical protein
MIKLKKNGNIDEIREDIYTIKCVCYSVIISENVGQFGSGEITNL